MYRSNMKNELKPWYSGVLNKVKDVFAPIGNVISRIVDWFRYYWFGLIMIVTILAVFGMCTTGIVHEEKRKAADRATWETRENFVKRQGRYYIYREEIEGHQYYIYRYENDYGRLVDWQVVPVNTCADVEPDTIMYDPNFK